MAARRRNPADNPDAAVLAPCRALRACPTATAATPTFAVFGPFAGDLPVEERLEFRFSSGRPELVRRVTQEGA
jgi:hypothetical protein